MPEASSAGARGAGRGRFIVIEGIDGCGSTTQVKRLALQLSQQGREVVATAEPSKGPLGILIRQILQGQCLVAGVARGFDWASMALLFAADRRDHVTHTILPALERGALVISDRYDLSSLAYQSATSPEGEANLPWLCAINARAVRPDLTVVLALDPDIAAERRRARGGVVEVYEDDALQRRLAAIYATAAELQPADNIVFVPARGSADEVNARLLEVVGPFVA